MQKLSKNFKFLASPLADKVSWPRMFQARESNDNSAIPCLNFLARPYSQKRRSKHVDLDHDHVVSQGVKKISNSKEQLEAQAHTWNRMFSFINSMSLRCAVQLGIPDAIHSHGQPISLPRLVAALPIHHSKACHVRRLMRILVHSGYFSLIECNQDEAYALTDASRLLLKDNLFTASPFVTAILDPVMIKPWHHLSAWFQNEDATAFSTAHGMKFWDYGRHDAEHSRAFNDAMASDSRLVASALTTDEHKRVFEGLESLVDVGGGNGTLAKAIAAAFPRIECVVFDLPHVVADLKGSQNLKFFGGDMFDSIPSADATLLKYILHNWEDEESVKILEQCRKAITSKGDNKKGKVIIIDMVIENKIKDDDNYELIETQLFLDMQMMVIFNGRERDEKEWAKLFSEAGFNGYKIAPGLGLLSIIEVYP